MCANGSDIIVAGLELMVTIENGALDGAHGDTTMLGTEQRRTNVVDWISGIGGNEIVELANVLAELVNTSVPAHYLDWFCIDLDKIIRLCC